MVATFLLWRRSERVQSSIWVLLTPKLAATYWAQQMPCVLTYWLNRVLVNMICISPICWVDKGSSDPLYLLLLDLLEWLNQNVPGMLISNVQDLTNF